MKGWSLNLEKLQKKNVSISPPPPFLLWKWLTWEYNIEREMLLSEAREKRTQQTPWSFLVQKVLITHFLFYRQWDAWGWAQALECERIVPAKWVSWDGNTNLFERLWVWGKKKKIDGLPVFRSIPLDDAAQWSSYLHYCPCSWKDLASCWLPSHVPIDFCPLLLPTCVPFPFPPISHLYFPFRRLTFHQKAGSSRNLPCLDLQNLFNQKSQGYIFLYFVVWGLVVLFISLFLGGIFCSSALS